MPITAQDPTLLCSVSVQNLPEADQEFTSATREHLLVKDLFPEPGSSLGGPRSAREQAPELVGNYELLKLLGQGSTGAVWQAVHRGSVRREVALKIMHADRHDQHALLRFAAEVRALASLDHPNIAKVWEYGSTPQGQPYLAMELIAGAPLVKYADTWCVPLHDRLRLMIAVCRGVQHAHQRGILHRDLKPANILVMRQEGMAIPKVIDFGLAKSMNGPLLPTQIETTQRGCLLGTIGYMSPEQADLDQNYVDTRSDVHALAAVLYELLTGTLPIPKEELHRRTLGDALELIRTRDPELPSRRVARLDEELCQSARCQLTAGQLSLKLQGDLDAIVLKGLAKEPAARYQSASELANDLERYLAGGIVQARQRTRWYVAHKLLRRHWKLASLIFAFSLVVLLGLVGTTWGLFWALEERTNAREAMANMGKAREKEASAKKDAQTYGQFLADVLTFVRPLGQGGWGKELTLLEALDGAVDKLSSRFSQQPRAGCQARLTLARSYLSLGRAAAAQRNVMEAITNAGTLEEEMPVFLHQARLLLVETYLAQNDLDRAEQECRGLLGDMPPAISAESYWATRQVRRLLTNVLAKQHKYAEAESLLHELITQEQGAVTPGATLEGDSRCDLVILYLTWGAQSAVKWAQADRLIDELLKVHAEDALKELQILNLRATLLRVQGMLTEAASLYETIFRRLNTLPSFRETHLFSLVIQKNLAMTFQALGRDDQAERLLEQAYHSQRDGLGLAHAMTQSTLQALIQLHEQRGRRLYSDRALEFADAWHKGRVEAHGAAHPAAIQSALRYGYWLLDCQRLAEAEKLLRELLNTLESAHADDANSMAQTFALLALASTEDPVRAETYFQQAMNQARKSNQGDVIALVQNHYGWRLHQLQRETEAENLLLGSLPNLPKDRHHLERGLWRLVQFYQDRGNTQQRDQWLWNWAELN